MDGQTLCDNKHSWRVASQWFTYSLIQWLIDWLIELCLYRQQQQLQESSKSGSGFLIYSTAFMISSCPAALCNLGSGSCLAWANDTAAHYAAIHCPRQRTVGPTVAASRHTTAPVSHTRPSPCSPPRVEGWVDLSTQYISNLLRVACGECESYEVSSLTTTDHGHFRSVCCCVIHGGMVQQWSV